MEDLSRGVAKLSVRSGSKANIERRRLGSEKEIEHDKKPGFLNSIKRLFTSDAKLDEPSKEKEDSLKDLPPLPLIQIQKPLYHAFRPVPSLSLPQVEDCSDYDIDICDYMYHFQATIPSDFLVNSAITPGMRLRIVTFMAERHGDYSAPLETFHIALYMVDSMLMAKSVSAENAEVICIAALSLAAKFERQVGLCKEILRDYDLARRLRYETLIFRTMNFCLGQHTVIHLMRILRAAVLTKEDAEESYAWNAAKVLSQVVMMDANLIRGTKPSLLAAAVMRLSLALIGRKWMEVYTAQSQHTKEEIEQKTRELCKFTKKIIGLNSNAIICKINFNLQGSDFIRDHIDDVIQLIDGQ